ncbi:GNAT family N-acetyltransferase [Leptolyngbya sp. PCC 6406]|uniref:GNAT family N-acetyltransferase n=1 Tax=Leptolyngbya sp. PCC 6406 TaxID=1173264 RepID=UPI0002ABB6D4|nr:GNAT family N-acetyltransferase [Leptolyngbya sp. PCC 6406]
MVMPPSPIFRVAAPQDDPVIAQHFYRMWRDLGMADGMIQPHWQAICLDFIDHARGHLQYQAFVAEVAGAIIGSAGGQRFDGLYPWIIAYSDRQYGYLWGVYVEPDYRHRGIATRLTQLVVEHLQGIGCTKVVLNAAPKARPLYQRLGFGDSNLMELNRK